MLHLPVTLAAFMVYNEIHRRRQREKSRRQRTRRYYVRPANVRRATHGGFASECIGYTLVFSYVLVLRQFVEAVLAYTGAKQVDVISHSMGVTLGRRILKGGQINDGADNCDVGPPLTANLDTFVGICGANRGLDACFAATEKTCDPTGGFYPGYCALIECLDTPADGLSTYLDNLFKDPIREAANVYSFWSRDDDVILFGDIVWGYPTSRIHGQDGQRVSDTKGHMAMKDETGEWQ